MTARQLSPAAWASIALVAAILGIGYLRFQQPPKTAVSTPGPATTAEAPATPEATGPGPETLCTRETGTLPAIVSSDPCPSAIAAVKAAVAGTALSIERIVIEPGPFYCDQIWPGIGTPSVCFGVNVRPGQFMHAWVRFSDSERVAAVMLGLDLPEIQDEPGATRPPWITTLVAVEVPPAGWVMP